MEIGKKIITLNIWKYEMNIAVLLLLLVIGVLTFEDLFQLKH